MGCFQMLRNPLIGFGGGGRGTGDGDSSMLGRGPGVPCIETGKTEFCRRAPCAVYAHSCFICTGKRNTVPVYFFFLPLDVYACIFIQLEKDPLQKEYDAASTGSQGFAFSDSHKYLFNQPASWQTFSSVSLAFNSTFLSLL